MTTISVDSIAARLCKSLVAEVAPVPRGVLPCVVTTLSYPNGDSINLYFSRFGKGIMVHDAGTTLDNFAASGLPDWKEREPLIDMICRRSGVVLVNGRLSIQARIGSIGQDSLTLCACIAQVASLHFHQVQPVRSDLPKRIAKLLQAKVKPKRTFIKGWFDSKIDPHGSFPVDYHFNGMMPARNLFYVTSDRKALLVVAVSHFLKSHEEDYDTMTIIDPDAVEPKQIERLQYSSDRLIQDGLKGNEDQVIEFALGK